MKNRRNIKPAEPEAHSQSGEQIELRAYYVWLTAGGGHGNDLDHLLQTEKEITARASAALTSPGKIIGI
jgi:hypothetical protein